MGHRLSEVDFNVVERVASFWCFDELFVVAVCVIGDAMEGVVVATRSDDVDFDGTTGVIRFAFGRDVIGLLQEVVVRPTYGAVRSCEDGGLVEAEGGDGEVLVHIGDMVHVLVPYGSCRRPVAGAAEGKDTSVTHFLGRSEKTCCHNLGITIAIDIGDNGVFDAGTSAHHAVVDVVRPDGVVTCDMALSAAVKDTHVLVVAVNEFHDAILVEIEKRDTCLT